MPDVWPVKKVSPNKMIHLTEKPVELARLAIEYSSLPGRRAYLMEFDPLYCDVTVERFERFSGKKALPG